ncbi:TerD family protein, partial [Streptomyces sp. NPDC054863]
MTAELVRGQNHPLPQARWEIRISAGQPVVAGATLGDEQGTVRGAERVAHPGSHQLPGLEVSRQAAADHRLAVDLGALPEDVHRVNVLLALPSAAGFPARFGAVAAPFVAVTGLDGAEVATYTLTGLDAESAVVALELYRRGDAWKVRAVGQGYAGGLAEMLADQGLPQARELAATIQEAVGRGLARSVAAPPPRTPDGDRARRTPPAARQGAAPSDAARHDASAAEPTAPGAGPQPASGTGPQPASATGPQSAPGAPSGAAPPERPAAPQGPQSPPGGPVNYSHPRRKPPARPAP